MLKRLTENIYYTEPEEATDRPVMGYIRGKKYSLMAEAGNSAETVRKFNADLAGAGLSPADFAVVTHHHWDHCFGIHALDAVTIALDKTNEILADMSKWKWSVSLLEEYIQTDRFPLFCRPHILLEYPDMDKICVRPADISFHDEMTVDLGGISCVLKKVTSPHTDDSIIIYVPEEKAVFFGDSLCEELVRDQWIDNKEKLAVLISELEAIDFEWGLEGHFLPKKKETIMKELKARL